eukprot:c14619_g2_i1 orf=14-616(+)
MTCLENCSRGSSQSTLHTPKERLAHYAERLRNSAESLDLPWKDNPKSQTSSTSPDFHFKHSESHWVHAWFDPCWVQEELRGRGLLPSTDNVEDGELCVEEAKKKMREPLVEKTQKKATTVMGSCCKTQQKEEVLIVGDDENQQLSQEDTSVAVSYVALLKACAKQKDLQRGNTLHTEIVQSGLLEKNLFVSSALVSMYAK